jgi:hypothetical protein
MTNETVEVAKPESRTPEKHELIPRYNRHVFGNCRIVKRQGTAEDVSCEVGVLHSTR